MHYYHHLHSPQIPKPWLERASACGERERDEKSPSRFHCGGVEWRAEDEYTEEDEVERLSLDGKLEVMGGKPSQHLHDLLHLQAPGLP